MGYNWAKQNMTNKIKIVSLLMVSAMLFFVGCKKNNSENETPGETVDEQIIDELIPEELLQLLDNCPIVNYQDPRVFGFNGKSDNPLDNLFDAMCKVAMHLTDGTTEYPAGENPDKEPRQKGLAYVYGWGNPADKPDHYSEDKDYRIRRRGYNSECDKYLHGIDCAGFIAHVMDSVGIHVISGKSLFKMKAWEQVKYFKELNHRTLKSNHYTGLVRVEEIENVSVANIINGDIIINNKNKASHIGIIFKKPGVDSLFMFQSAGDPSYSCERNKRGPVQRRLSQPNLEDYFTISSGNARLLRITIDSNWVYLGHPKGKLWATRNVGANSPEKSGYYFAWGETEEDSYYDWKHYKHCTVTTDWYGNITNWQIIKYNENDHLTTLESVDDAADAHWSNLGNNCRIPTKNDWNELITHCTPNWITKNGVKGVLLNAKNGESLFLPAVGFRHLEGLYNTGQYEGYGFYWTSSLDTVNSNNASHVRFNYNSENPVLKEDLRLFGLSVRPVCDSI